MRLLKSFRITSVRQEPRERRNLADYDWDFSDPYDDKVWLRRRVKELEGELVALRTKKLFTNDVENVFVPAGKQVKSVQVINDRGVESVQIVIEDEPTLPPEVLADVTVKRG